MSRHRLPASAAVLLALVAVIATGAAPAAAGPGSALRLPTPAGPYPVDHYGFTDWVAFHPQAENAVPGLGAALEQILPTGTAGDLNAGRHAMADQRSFLSTFLDRYTRCELFQTSRSNPAAVVRNPHRSR